MENISELKQHLRAIEQTRQISNAMYLLSTSRMKQSMQHIDYNLAYMRKLRATIKDIISKTKHNMLTDPFIELTEGGKALFFVITSDKGLCGGYNSAVFNLAMEKMRGYEKPVVYSLGYKGTEMFLNHGITPDDSMYGASQRPSLYSARALGERIVELYSNPGETVFTPFMGIGSEAYQALKMGRKAIGIELKEEYFNQSVENCKEAADDSQITFFDI